MGTGTGTAVVGTVVGERRSWLNGEDFAGLLAPGVLAASWSGTVHLFAVSLFRGSR